MRRKIAPESIAIDAPSAEPPNFEGALLRINADAEKDAGRFSISSVPASLHTEPGHEAQSIKRTNTANYYEDLSVERYCRFFSVFVSKSQGRAHGTMMEKDFAKRKYHWFRSAFVKSSMLMALTIVVLISLAVSVAIAEESKEQWLRVGLLSCLVLPGYLACSILASLAGKGDIKLPLYLRLSGNWKEFGLVALLSIQSVTIVCAEFQRKLPSPGLISLHMAFVHNFSPLSIGHILIVSAVFGLPTHLVSVALYRTWRKDELSATLETCGSSNGGSQLRALLDFVLPAVILFSQFVLTAGRDRMMRIDMLLRERLRAQRTELKMEVRKSEDLLKCMLPPSIIACLMLGEPVHPEYKNEVTVIFAQVCDFSLICEQLTPAAVLEVLNAVYSKLDSICDSHHVYKVETVGDVYMAVVGCPEDEDNNAEVAAQFALAAQAGVAALQERIRAMLKGAKDVCREHASILSANDLELKIRIGLHTGKIRAGIVGIDKPRYKLFGDTVNTASRMESTCPPGKIQMSQSTLDSLPPDAFETDGPNHVPVKGKGSLSTWFLKGYAPGFDGSLRRSAHSLSSLAVVHTRTLSPKAQRASLQSSNSSSSNFLRTVVGGLIENLSSQMMDPQLREGSVDLTDIASRTKRWFIDFDSWWLMVEDESKTPGMLASLHEDTADFLAATANQRMTKALSLISMWHVALSCAFGLDLALDLTSGENSEYRAGVLLRSWGIQVVGWLHTRLVLSKKRFAAYGQLITVSMLLLQCASIVAASAMIYDNELSLHILFGFYALFSNSCRMGLRLLICDLALGAWLVIEYIRCGQEVGSRPVELVGFNFGLFILNACGLRMQEHLHHCANFYHRRVDKKIKFIDETRQGSKAILANLLPPHVVEKVSLGVSPIAEPYEDVTIIFTDIKGFTAFCSGITPMELVELLNSLYSAFDEVIMTWGLHKVEVIGDAYFISSGCPAKPGEATLCAGDHAMRAVEVALALLRVMPAVCDDSSVQMRVGLHTGDVIAGVVGKKGPRYQLFGPTVEYANFMESTGVPGRVQISDVTCTCLEDAGHLYDMEERSVEVKGEICKAWLVTRSKAEAAKRYRASLASDRLLQQKSSTRSGTHLLTESNAPRAPWRSGEGEAPRKVSKQSSQPEQAQ
eukprot:TRINITY_DN32790_c0_g1_i1.p1 TRINITY_DN32790_c0_g1~~TRINITY_DN32790_c0_g1_i1.p1  ORF type:complete len:1141 (-),score=211.37 TRINITY_DN32790_c0_g1_i1:54-3476(-)